VHAAGLTLLIETEEGFWGDTGARTAALVEAVGAPKENVRVWIHDVPKENWGIAGVSAKALGR